MTVQVQGKMNMNRTNQMMAFLILAAGFLMALTSSALEDAAYPKAHVDMTDAKAVAAFYRDTMERLADFALVPPKYIQHPGGGYGGKYVVTNLDYCMCGTVTVTKKGRIWAGWFSGGDDPRGFFCAARSDDGGRTWSGPEFVIDPHDSSLPVPRFTLCADLWVDPKGRLHLFHDQTMGGYYRSERYFLNQCTTSDSRRGVWHAVCEDPDAETLVWSKPERIADGNCLNKPFVAKDGTWFLPIARGIHAGHPFGVAFFETCEKVKGAWLLASTDEGRTWSFRGGVRFPESTWFEHMAYEMRDGRLRMFSRSLNKEHGIYEAYSSDGGRTWTDPVPAAAAGIDAPCSRFHVRRLKSGNILFVKHGDTMSDRNRLSRSNLRAFLSKDDGRTWLGGLLLEPAECSYPDVYEADDGALHVVYDHARDRAAELRYARITEADILAGKLVDPKSVLKMRAFKAFRNHMKQYAKERESSCVR